MSFDMEREHQLDKEDWEAYEQKRDADLLERIWLINPEIKTLQMRRWFSMLMLLP